MGKVKSLLIFIVSSLFFYCSFYFFLSGNGEIPQVHLFTIPIGIFFGIIFFFFFNKIDKIKSSEKLNFAKIVPSLIIIFILLFVVSFVINFFRAPYLSSDMAYPETVLIIYTVFSIPIIGVFTLFFIFLPAKIYIYSYENEALRKVAKVLVIPVIILLLILSIILHLTCTFEINYACLEKDALKQNNPNACLKISDEYYAGICLLRIARDTNDIGICDYIKDVNMENTCVSDIAIGLQDPEICDQSTNENYRNNCLRWLSLQLNDKNICERISNDIEKDTCKSL